MNHAMEVEGRVMQRTILLVVFLATLGSMASARGEESNPCVAVYAGAMRQLEWTDDEGVVLDRVSRNLCNNRQWSGDAGFDSTTKTLIGSIPVVSKFAARVGASSRKSYCEAYDREYANYSRKTDLKSIPLDYAGKNFNECVRFHADSRVYVTHALTSDGNLSINLRVPEDVRLRIEGLSSKDFSCTMPGRWGSMQLGRDTTRTVTQSTTIGCVREAKEAPEGYVYPPTSVQLRAGSSGTYTIEVPDTTILGPDTKRAFADRFANLQRERDHLNERIAGVKATAAKVWVAGGAPNSDYMDPVLGYFFATNSMEWHGDQTPLWNRVYGKLCPKGGHTLDHTGATSGGCCGKNFYILTCLTIPD